MEFIKTLLEDPRIIWPLLKLPDLIFVLMVPLKHDSIFDLIIVSVFNYEGRGEIVVPNDFAK